MYRELGHRNADGKFEPPLSLQDAISMPEAEREVFRTLDYVYGKMEAQFLEKKMKKLKAQQNG